VKVILIVDDEVDITVSYSLLFQLHGFETLTAANGREALGIIGNRRPDLIISDLMMPIMDGVAFSKILRASPDTASIPLILMSAAPERHELSSTAYDAFIRKPSKFQDLLAAVGRLLKPE
jgi:CheY-like chemotaxis protein